MPGTPSEYENVWGPNAAPWYRWQMETAIRHLIEGSGERVSSNPHLANTPKRFLDAWEHWTSGYGQDPAAVLKTFEQDTQDFDTMVFQASTPIWSLCAHHLAPFWGVAHVAYVPNGTVLGLSKIARLIDVFARRLQTQENLGCQLVDALMTHVPGIKGAAAVLQCRHACIESRGVQKSGAITVTSALRGCFKDEPDCRAEFMQLVNVAVQGAKGV